METPWEQDLLRHEAFLRRLARRLVSDEATADDLVQDAFVLALEHPARRGQGLGSWLARAVRRGAGHGRRAARRRSGRERAAARPEGVEDHLREVDERLDAHASLLAQLQRLPDAQRQVLYLRYAEDRSPPEIAALLDVPADTVKTRLRRGRERLRELLDRRYGDRCAWLAAFSPPASTTAVSLTAASTAALGKGIAMATAWKVGGALAACVLAWVWLGERGERTVEPDITPVAAADPDPEVEPGLLPAEPEARQEIEADPDPGLVVEDFLDEPIFPPGPFAAPSAEWPLIVRTTGASAVGATVRVKTRLDAWGVHNVPALSAELDAAGEARFDIGSQLAELLAHGKGARAEEVVASVDHPDLVPAEASLILPDGLDPLEPPEEPLVLTVALEPAAVVIGRMVDGASGQPFAGNGFLQAHRLTGDEPADSPSGWSPMQPNGSFRLRLDAEGDHAIALLVPDHRPATARVSLVRGRVHDLGDVVPTAGVAIEGTSLSSEGRPLADANVFAALKDSKLYRVEQWNSELPMYVGWVAGAFEASFAHVKSDARARFRLPALAQASYELDVQDPDIHVPVGLSGKLVVQAPAEVELRPQACTLVVNLVVPAGVQLQGHEVWNHAGRRIPHQVSPWQFEFETVRRYALPPGTDLTLTLNYEGLEPEVLEVQTLGVGARIERTVELRRDAGTAQVTFELRGVAVEDGTTFAIVHGNPLNPERESRVEVRDGRLILEDLQPGPGRWTITAGQDRYAPQDYLCAVEVRMDLAAGERRVEPLHLTRGGTLILEAFSPEGQRIPARCTVLDADGEELDLVFVARTESGRAAARGHLMAGGPCRATPPLAPGRYRVRLESSHGAPQDLTVVVEAGKTTRRRADFGP